jgi:putative oxidoreductase
MQRLYSTFPNSWPAVALLIMRLGQGVQVLSGNHLDAVEGLALTDTLLYGLELLTAGSLAIGLWSPVAGLLQSLLECRRIYAGGRFNPAHFDCALLAFCLSLLGPGAWSIDARLFGRRRVRIDRHPGS